MATRAPSELIKVDHFFQSKKMDCQARLCLAFRILALTTGSCAFSQPEREKVKYDSPCPIRMFANNGRATKCGEIYCYVCMFANNGRATTFLVGVY